MLGPQATGDLREQVRREVMNHSRLAQPHVAAFHSCFLTTHYLAIATEHTSDYLGTYLYAWCVAL